MTSRKTFERPSSSPMLLFAVGLWVAVFVSFGLLPTLHVDYRVVALISSVLALTILVALIKFRKGLFLPLLGIVVGVLCCVQLLTTLDDAADYARNASSGSFDFVATEDASSGDFGQSVEASFSPDGTHRFTTVVRYSNDDLVIRCGETFHAKVTVSELSDVSAQRYLSKGIGFTVKAYDIHRTPDTSMRGALTSIRERGIETLSRFSGDGAVLLKAILLADRTMLTSSDVYANFKAVGLAHLVAVSGAHLVMVTMLLQLLLTLFRVPKIVSIAIQVPALLAYLVLTGMPISCLRACFMALCSLLSYLGSRRASSINSLSLCVCFFVVLDPTCVFSVSFQLSVGATAGILLLMSMFTSYTERLPHSVGDTLSMTCAACVPTTPVAASLFSQVPLLCAPVNLVAAPAFAVLCSGGMLTLVLALIVPPLTFPLEVMVMFAQAFVELIALIASLPFAACPVSIEPALGCGVSVGLTALLWLVWPVYGSGRIGYFLIAALISMLVTIASHFFEPSDSISALDVGQGDAILLQSNGKSLLVDTGTDDAKLLSGLAARGVTSLDGVLITHPDDDHCGSLGALEGIVNVGSVFVAHDLLSSKDTSCTRLHRTAQNLVGDSGVVGLSVGDCITLGNASARVLWPYRYEEDGSNAESLILDVTYDTDRDGEVDVSALLTGDGESQTLDELDREGSLHRFDILKVGHHGSKVALTDHLLDIIDPDVALISDGANNRYGHPTAETLTALINADTVVMRTDESGTLVCDISADGITMRSLG